jgi:Predicted permease.
MGICSTTALATGFAMKERYYNMIVFDNKYTFQLLTNQPNLEERAAELIQKETDIVCQTSLPVLSPDASHLVVSYTDIIRVTNESGVLFPLTEPLENETYYLSYQVLMSFILSKEVQTVTIGNDTFFQAGIVREPCLGYMQREMGCFYVVSDSTYSRMKEYSTMLYIHNYKIADNAAFERARTAVDVLISNTDENFTARVAVDPFDNGLEWIKVLHALCIFMFLVFIVAGGCIMFMKLYNDSFEERERYLVLKKLGFSTQTLTKSIAHELISAYVLPFVVMAVSTYFSVHALGMVMYAELLSVYIVSILAVMIVFALCCIFSVSVYRRNVGLR